MQTRPIEERGDVKKLRLRGWNLGSWCQDQFGLSTMDLILKTGSSIKGHFGPSITGLFGPSTVDLSTFFIGIIALQCGPYIMNFIT